MDASKSFVAVFGVDGGCLKDASAPYVQLDAGLCGRPAGWVAGRLVWARGHDTFATEVCAAEILNIGHHEVELKSDQEASTIALKEAVAASKGNGFP